MKIYLVKRWGNPDSERGPDGEDTNFLVCANSVECAGLLVDEKLKLMPTKKNGHKPVEPFAHYIRELGEASAAFKDELLLCGPWVAYEYMSGWPENILELFRDNKDQGWKLFEER